MSLFDPAFLQIFAALVRSAQWEHRGTQAKRITGVREPRIKRGRWMGSLKVGRLGDLEK